MGRSGCQRMDLDCLFEDEKLEFSLSDSIADSEDRFEVTFCSVVTTSNPSFNWL
jgi:hypothetical protein